MPSFPPNTGWQLPSQSDEPHNDWGTPYNKPARAPNQMVSMGLGTQPDLSQTEMFNYLLRFYHSHAPAPFVGPAHNHPAQDFGLNPADLVPLPQDQYPNDITAGFNDPSMQGQIANMHPAPDTNQALSNIDLSMQDPIPVQEQEQGPATRTPQPAPHRGRRGARSRPRPYERR